MKTNMGTTSFPCRRCNNSLSTLVVHMGFGALLTISGAGQSVWANESSAASGQPDSIETVIVTATRQSENIQLVPVTVTSISQMQLTQSGVDNLQSLGVLVPGLEVQNSDGFATLHLRGVGSSATGPGIENPVALYVDGVYYASEAGSFLSFNNIDRVEVLYGPQGTLFGRNATGGLVQVITKDPTQELQFKVNGGYGSYNTSETDAYVSAGITSYLAADMAVRGSFQGEGYGRDLSTGEDVNRTDRDISFRSKWLLTPNTGTRITLILDHSENSNSQLAFRINPGTSIFPLTGPAYGGSPWDMEGTQPFAHIDSSGVTLHVDQDLGFARLESVSAARTTELHKEFDLDGTATLFENGDVYETDRQFSQELHLLSPKGTRLQWQTGLYYFYATGTYDPATISLNSSESLNPDYPIGSVSIFNKEETQSYAGFAQATYEFPFGTNLTLGGRYTKEHRTISGSELADLVGGTPFGAIATDDASADFSKATVRASLDHRFNEDVMAFASFNTGFKSGGFDPSTFSAIPFKPETLKAYEAGVKTDLLDRRFRLNVSGFYYDYSQIQIEQIQAASIAVINGAKATMYGLDAHFDAIVAAQLTLSGALELENGQFDSFPNAPTGQPGGGIPVVTASADGNVPAVMPKATATLSANYHVPLRNSSLEFIGTYQYNSGWYAEPDNIIRQSAFSQLNATSNWEFGNGHYHIGLWGRNLTNVAVQSYGATLQIGNQIVSYNPPRTYGVNFGYAY